MNYAVLKYRPAWLIKVLFTTAFVCVLSPFAFSQFDSVTVSEKKADMYLYSINHNKKIVSFIEYTLTANGLPKFLRNLALIESDFQKNCVSSAQAAGIWQFTKDDANEHGLSDTDRYDVYKSTQAVVLDLKELYSKYHNWITVVAAYNCGMGNVHKAIAKAGSDKYEMFYTYLPWETIYHVHKFIMACKATKEIDLLLADYKQFSDGEDSLKKLSGRIIQISDTSQSLASTEINQAFDPVVIAEELGILSDDFNKWNPDLSDALAKNGKALLFLPAGRMPDFLLLRENILRKSLNKNTSSDDK